MVWRPLISEASWVWVSRLFKLEKSENWPRIRVMLKAVAAVKRRKGRRKKTVWNLEAMVTVLRSCKAGRRGREGDIYIKR